MGRYINCKIDGEWEIVWKYVFGAQSSEMYRIHEDLGLGEYHPVCIEDRKDENGEYLYQYVESRSAADYDILILKQDDVVELNEWIEVLEGDTSLNKKNKHFIAMLKAMRNFMLARADREEIVFKGEF